MTNLSERFRTLRPARKRAPDLDGADRQGADDRASYVSIKNLTQRFPGRQGGTFLAVEDVSFKMARGEFVAVIGPSGCGKSTALNVLAGVFPPTEGVAAIGGVPVAGPRPDVGYMIARDALLPWRRARQNVEFFLENRGVSRKERRARAESLLESMGLGDFKDAYPHQLSQGMRQRVSLARTLAPNPNLLLMDEPFSALDAQTRRDVQEWFLEIWEREHKTVLFVTHDLEEAILLADRVVVMTGQPGRIHLERTVPLPRPRGKLALWLFNPTFRALHEEIWRDLETASLQNNVRAAGADWRASEGDEAGAAPAHLHHSGAGDLPEESPAPLAMERHREGLLPRSRFANPEASWDQA